MAVSPDLLYTECATACAGIAAVTDLRSRRIPNWLTASGVLAGLLLHLLGAGTGAAGLALLSGIIAGGIFLMLFIAGGMGAGDVKLMAAVGCLAGIHSLRSILLVTVLAGALAAVVAAVVNGRLRETASNVRALLQHHQNNGLVSHPEFNVHNAGTLRIPYAVPIAAGCIVTLILGLYGSTAL